MTNFILNKNCKPLFRFVGRGNWVISPKGTAKTPEKIP